MGDLVDVYDRVVIDAMELLNEITAMVREKGGGLFLIRPELPNMAESTIVSTNRPLVKLAQ